MLHETYAPDDAMMTLEVFDQDSHTLKWTGLCGKLDVNWIGTSLDLSVYTARDQARNVHFSVWLS